MQHSVWILFAALNLLFEGLDLPGFQSDTLDGRHMKRYMHTSYGCQDWASGCIDKESPLLKTWWEWFVGFVALHFHHFHALICPLIWPLLAKYTLLKFKLFALFECVLIELLVLERDLLEVGLGMFELEKELILPLILCRLFSSQSYESSLEVWVEFLINSILEGYLLEAPINRVSEDDTLITLSDANRISHA